MSQSEILQALKDGTLSIEQASVLLGNSKPVSPIKFKVSEKGALSVYGLGRFPTTLYRGQWERLIAAVDDMKEFIGDHSNELAVKE